jgi:hypothetical protein
MGYTPSDVDRQCRIMINFYNYLMMHNVCPEFTDDIMAARRVCERGQYELPTITTFEERVHGGVNLACSVLFGGHYAQAYGGNVDRWVNHDAATEDTMPVEKARLILCAAIGALGTDEMFDAVFSTEAVPIIEISKLKFTKEEAVDLEVVRVEKPSGNTQDFYADQNKVQLKVNLKPLGRLVCKPWKKDIGPTSYDLPKGVLAAAPPSQAEFTFWLEGDTLDYAFEGMKFSASIRYLAFDGCQDGVWVLDATSKVYCSFYTWILNELLDKPYQDVRMLTSEDAKAGEGRDDAVFVGDGKDGGSMSADE